MYNNNANGPQNGNIDPRQAIQQFVRQIGNPQQLVQRFYGFVPQNIQNDPEQIINYLINTYKVSPQQIDYIRAYIEQNNIK